MIETSPLPAKSWLHQKWTSTGRYVCAGFMATSALVLAAKSDLTPPVSREVINLVPCQDGFDGRLVRAFMNYEHGTYHALSCGVIEAYKKNPWTPYKEKPGEKTPPPGMTRS